GGGRWGWVGRAGVVPWRVKRFPAERPSSAAFSSLTATWPVNRPSLRSASQTLPIPPWPIGDTSVYGPTATPASEGSGRGITAGDARKPSAVNTRCSASSAWTSSAVCGSSPPSATRYASHSIGARSSSRSRWGLPRRQRSVLLALISCPPDQEIGNGRQNPTSLERCLVPEHPVEVNPGLLPVALHGALRHVHHRADFCEREPAKELQV